jgi:hypothetical protein
LDLVYGEQQQQQQQQQQQERENGEGRRLPSAIYMSSGYNIGNTNMILGSTVTNERIDDQEDSNLCTDIKE